MSLHDTRRTNFVLSELLIWTKYLQYALQRMYEVANECDEEKEALKEDLATAEAKLASKDEELQETQEDVSRHEEQLFLQQMADLNNIEAQHAAEEISQPGAKAESKHSLKSEINRLSRQLAICERSNTS